MGESTLNFGSDSQNLIIAFKENSSQFLSSKDISEEAFLFDVLQALFEERVSDSSKLRLLLLVQEHSERLVTSLDSLEQALGSLRNVYQQYHGERHNFFRGQILVTMTTMLLLSVDQQEKSMDTIPLFRELFDELMKVVVDKNNVNNCLLRAAACQCLTEMESNSPGFLSPVMDCLQDLCKQEKTYIAQHYLMLFTLVLRQHKMIETDPFNKVHTLVSEVTNRHLGVKSGVVTPRLSSVEQKQSLSYLMEHLPFMSTPVALAVVRDAIHVVLDSKIVPPSIFKALLLASLYSYDISVLHLVLELQMNFGELIFTSQEVEQVVMHFVLLTKLPCLSPAHRLLLLDWLEEFISRQGDLNRGSGSDDDSKLYLQPSAYPSFIPTVLDGWETITKKFLLLAQLMGTNFTKADTSFVLWGCINFIYDLGNLTMSHRAASTFFRCLSTLLRFHQLPNTEVEATKLVVKFMNSHPKFTSHVHDFTTMLKEEFKDSELPQNVQRAVVEFITKNKKSSSLIVLPHYLKILEHISEENETICQPNLIVRFLKKLLTSTSVCELGNWLLGNQILSVCRMILHHHDTRFFFREFGEVLFAMMTSFRDADVQDMARLLYMLLTHVSSKKIRKMFDQQLRSATYLAPLNLATSTTNYSGTRTIIIINEQVLQLVKVSPKVFEESTSNVDGEIDIPKNTLRPYRVYVGGDTFKAVAKVPCHLQIVKEFAEKFEAIYCVDIEVEGPELFGKFDNILVPSVHHDSSCVVDILFCPSKSFPATLVGTAAFSTKDGETYQSLVSLPTLDFEDFFLPLPIPPTFVLVANAWHQHLFEDLWASFSKSAMLGAEVSSCQESVVLLKMSALKMESAVEQKLKPFVVHSSAETDFTLHEIGIFVPPSNHILLRLEVKPASTVCRIVVDQWKLLPLLNEFCLSLEDL